MKPCPPHHAPRYNFHHVNIGPQGIQRTKRPEFGCGLLQFPYDEFSKKFEKSQRFKLTCNDETIRTCLGNLVMQIITQHTHAPQAKTYTSSFSKAAHQTCQHTNLGNMVKDHRKISHVQQEDANWHEKIGPTCKALQEQPHSFCL